MLQAEHRVLLIKVTQSLEEHPHPDELLAAVRGWWVVAARRRQDASSAPQYVAAVRRSRVVAVYAITAWVGPDENGRWAFDGDRSPELDRLYVGMDVGDYYPRGAANPLRYVHCHPATRTDEPSLELLRSPRRRHQLSQTAWSRWARSPSDSPRSRCFT